MLDFTPIRDKTTTWEEFIKGTTQADLVRITNSYYDKIEELIADCTDADVVFTPLDPEAHDPYAADAADEDLAWNLGHVIVHITASNEESAFLAAELARGVKFEARRSRSEVPWETVTTMAQVHQYLAESRRMLLASLEIWPDDPHLDNYYQTKLVPKVTPIMRFLFGISHADNHLNQIVEIVKQATA